MDIPIWAYSDLDRLASWLSKHNIQLHSEVEMVTYLLSMGARVSSKYVDGDQITMYKHLAEHGRVYYIQWVIAKIDPGAAKGSSGITVLGKDSPTGYQGPYIGLMQDEFLRSLENEFEGIPQLLATLGIGAEDQ